MKSDDKLFIISLLLLILGMFYWILIYFLIN